MRHLKHSRKRATGMIAAPLGALILLGGCASTSYAPLPETVAVSDGGGSAAQRDSGLTPIDSIERSVITTGSATLTVDKPAEAADEAVKITEKAGGRVDGRSEYAPTAYSDGSASLMLRIPAEKLSSVIEEFKTLGDLQEISLNASDVTLQVQDLDARITAMRTSIERLTALLAQADDVDALIALETAISDRQGQLESMLAEQRWLKDQVSMSTLQLQLVTVRVAQAPTPATFWDGIIAGWAAFVAFLGGLAVVVGFLLPWLVIAGVVVIVIVALVRRRRRRRHGAQPPANPSGSGMQPAATAVTIAPGSGDPQSVAGQSDAPLNSGGQ